MLPDNPRVSSRARAVRDLFSDMFRRHQERIRCWEHGERVRVAIITESFLPSINGVTATVLRVLDHLHRRGHPALVVAPGEGATEHRDTPVIRVPAVDLPRLLSIPVGLPWRGMFRAVARFAPDVDAVAALHRAGMRVRLVVAGDGPRRRALQRRAAALPVTFLGFLARRAEVASLLASADLVLAPGPHETFGLAALEALACGTPVVVSRSSALAEIVRPECGRAVADHAQSFASGVREVLAVDGPVLRAAARKRAEQFTWSAAVDGMLKALRAS